MFSWEASNRVLHRSCEKVWRLEVGDGYVYCSIGETRRLQVRPLYETDRLN